MQQGSWHGVVARTSEGVAAKDAFESQPAPFERTILDDGLLGILRAGGRVAACRRGERRYALLVEFYQQQEGLGEEGLKHDAERCMCAC